MRLTHLLSCVLIGTHLAAGRLLAQDGVLCSGRDIISMVQISDAPRDMAVAGGYAYAITYETDLWIVDISDPTDLRTVSSVNVGGSINQMVATTDDDRVIVAGASQIAFVDVSDATAPTVIAEHDFSDVTAMQAVGPVLFVTKDERFAAYDISSSDEITRLSIHDGIARAGAFTVRDSIAYVAAGADGVHTLDVSDPTNIVSLGRLATGRGNSFHLHGDILMCSWGQAGVELVDVSDVTSPISLGFVDSPLDARNARADVDRLYISDLSAGIAVYEYDGYAGATYLGSISSFNSVFIESLGNDVIFSSAYVHGMATIDVSRPKPTNKLSRIFPDDETYRLEIADGYAFVPEAREFQVYDISDPSAPTLVAALPIAQSFLTDVRLKDGIALVTGGTPYRLYAIDVRVPTEPVLLTTLTAPASLEWLDIEGDFAFVSAQSSPLVVYDISDPTDPQQVAFVREGSRTAYIRVEGDYAFVRHVGGRIRVFDVSDPTNPVLTNFIELRTHQPHVSAMEVVDGILYTGMPNSLQLVDVTDPLNPQLLQAYPFTYSINSFKLVGDRLFVHAGDVHVYDVSDATDPVFLASFDGAAPLEGWARIGDVEVVGDTAIVVGGGLAPIEFFDISDCPPCPADLNNDGRPDSRDLIAFLGAWSSDRARDCSSGDCETDLDGNGAVDTRDFDLFLDLWTQGC